MGYEYAPAFIPVPVDLQHRRVEAIFWPLDESPQKISPQAAPQQPEAPAVPLMALSQLIGKTQGCFDSATEVDAFLRAERDAWDC